LILQALIRAGRLSEAQQTLELRRASDPDGVPLNRALAEVYGRLGLLEEAAKARARVERRLAARA
jgi:predicted Zn-dependent protease